MTAGADSGSAEAQDPAAQVRRFAWHGQPQLPRTATTQVREALVPMLMWTSVPVIRRVDEDLTVVDRFMLEAALALAPMHAGDVEEVTQIPRDAVLRIAGRLTTLGLLTTSEAGFHAVADAAREALDRQAAPRYTTAQLTFLYLPEGDDLIAFAPGQGQAVPPMLNRVEPVADRELPPAAAGRPLAEFIGDRIRSGRVARLPSDIVDAPPDNQRVVPAAGPVYRCAGHVKRTADGVTLALDLKSPTGKKEKCSVPGASGQAEMWEAIGPGRAPTRTPSWPPTTASPRPAPAPGFAGRPLSAHPGKVHKTSGVRDPATAFPLPARRDDTADRRDASRAVAVSAAGLAATGIIELLLAVATGSVGLLGDAIHNLSDVSTSAVVFLGFRLSRRPPSERYPYGLERAEDLAGVGIAVVIWASAAFAGYESVRKLIEHGHTAHVGAGIAGAVIGIIGNQAVARYKLRVGKRIGSATLVADARHSWLDALSSAGALAGLVAVAAGQPWGDPVAGLAVTVFICHVGWKVTSDVTRRLADGVDPEVIQAAEAAAGSVPGVVHAHARARWTGRTLRVEIEGWVNPETTARDADALGRQVATAVASRLPEAGSLTWTTRAAP